MVPYLLFHIVNVETPHILTKEWIESITDIDELYSLINQFPNNPLTPSINKRIKLLEEQNESKKYRERF
ncbi:MAG: hypothetical protein IPO26_20055 [Saprospiraceae bacterium]|nr:hypothetical protein [Saprospiraceae bacterium]